MSRKEVAFLVSRAFALLSTSWAILDATYIPERAISLTHSVLAAESSYWERYHLLLLAGTVLRIGGLLLAAIVFWKPGKLIEKLLVGNLNPEEPKSVLTANSTP